MLTRCFLPIYFDAIKIQPVIFDGSSRSRIIGLRRQPKTAESASNMLVPEEVTPAFEGETPDADWQWEAVC